MNFKNNLNFTILLLLFTILILLLSGSGFSSVVIHFSFFIILSRIVKHDKLPTLNIYLLGTLVIIFFYHYWIILFDNPYFLGLKSDDFQFDYVWSEGFVEKFGLNFSELPYHLDQIEPGLGFLHNSKAYVAIIISLRYFAHFFDGYNTFLPRILNIFFLTLLAYYSSRIVYLYSNNHKLRRLTLFVTFFFPVLIFVSVHVFRDILISLMLIWIYYTLLNKNYSLLSLIKILVILFVLFFLRTTTFFVSLLMILILLSKIKKINFKLLSVIIIFFVFTFLAMQSILLDALVQIEGYNKLNTIRFGTLGTLTFSIPIQYGFISRILYLIFTPVISVSSFHQFFVSLSSIIQILAFPYLISSFRIRFIDIKLKLTFLIFFLGVAFTTADFRHVSMYIPFGVIICVLAFDKLKESSFSVKKYYAILYGLVISFLLNLIFVYLF